MTETKPKRRWFRFGLRTLFVLVTIACVGAGWVAYQLNWIRQRHKIVAFYGAAFAPKVEFYLSTELVSYAIPENLAPNRVAPWHLRLFGEYGCSEIGLFRNIADKELVRIRHLFPEAEVIRTDEEP